MIRKSLLLFLLSLLVIPIYADSDLSDYPPVDGRWSVEKANAWYAELPWLIGCNYYPSTAINQIDMWQEATWDPKTIDKELGMAASIGMNTLRVYLHDLVWADDEQGLYRRMDQFLDICSKHGIRPFFVFFDDCHFPDPKLGVQPLPVKRYHNSGWVNCPAREVALRFAQGKASAEEIVRLKGYVQETMRRFKDDKRVLFWELYNEPGRGRGESGNMAGVNGSRTSMGDTSNKLVYSSWIWARQVNPSQPICSNTAGSVGENNIAINRANSDIHSIHCYSPPDRLEKLILDYKQDGRPVIVTEWLARTNGSTVTECLPVLKKHHVGAVNWGFVSGKSGTIWPWTSRRGVDVTDKRASGQVVKPGQKFPEPKLWFHDLYRIDGTPFDQAEIDTFRRLTETKSIPSDSKDFLFPDNAPAAPVKPAMKRGEIEAGLKSHDRALYIKQGWIRDPYIILGPDGYYYLTGTTPNPADPREQSDPYNVGLGNSSIVGTSVQIWRSKDLIDWKYLGTPFTLENDSWHKNPGNRIWAPELHWLGNRWALVHCPRQKANFALTEGAELKGPWTHPMGENLGGKHDPSLFKDSDGKWYMLWQNTMIAPLNADFTQFTAEPVRIDPAGTRTDPKTNNPISRIGHEGATMRKIGSKYVHFGTAWSTDLGRKGSYNLYYCTADKITGPYGPRRFVGRFLGHGTPFQTRDGKWWCTAFFNANVPPVSRDGIQTRDLSETAQTINQRGTTIVPLEVKIQDDGDVYIRAKDPDYANPGPDEAQKFQKVEVAGKKRRPNVLMLLVDDLKPAISTYGDPIVISPNLDKLTERGIRFENAYCNQAVCAPSRFNLMLGSHSTASGLYGLGSKVRQRWPDAVTLPQYFSKHGYRTESLGKVFHVGHGNPGDPQSFDAPHFKDKVVEYVLPESNDGGKLTREEGYFSNQGNRDKNGNLRPRGAAWEAPDVSDEAYADGRVAAETIKRLEAASKRSQPFFIAAGFARPHLPFTVPKKYWDMYDADKFKLAEINTPPIGAPRYACKGSTGGEISAYKPIPERGDMPDEYARKLIHGYYASVSYTDTQIGKVLSAVDRLGLDDNTIIVLWGDHGFHLGELGMWTKHVNYEKATRIPIVIIAPGVTKPGSVTMAHAETVDIYPTLAELAGLPAPTVPQPISGKSLVPVLKNPAQSVRDHAFHCFPRGGMLGRAIRTERYRMVEWLPQNKRAGVKPEYELYDYSEGDVETVNLADKRPDLVKKLKSILDTYPEPVK